MGLRSFLKKRVNGRADKNEHRDDDATAAKKKKKKKKKSKNGGGDNDLNGNDEIAPFSPTLPSFFRADKNDNGDTATPEMNNPNETPQKATTEEMQRTTTTTMTPDQKQSFLNKALEIKTVRNTMSLEPRPPPEDESTEDRLERIKRGRMTPSEKQAFLNKALAPKEINQQQEKVSEMDGSPPPFSESMKEEWFDMVSSSGQFQSYRSVMESAAEQPQTAVEEQAQNDGSEYEDDEGVDYQPFDNGETFEAASNKQLQDLTAAKRTLYEQQQFVQTMPAAQKKAEEMRRKRSRVEKARIEQGRQRLLQDAQDDYWKKKLEEEKQYKDSMVDDEDGCISRR